MSVVLFCAAAGWAGAQQGVAAVRPKLASPTRLTPATLAAHAAESIDAGDGYATPDGRRALRRVPGRIALRLEVGSDARAMSARWTGRGLRGRNCRSRCSPF